MGGVCTDCNCTYTRQELREDRKDALKHKDEKEDAFMKEHSGSTDGFVFEPTQQRLIDFKCPSCNHCFGCHRSAAPQTVPAAGLDASSIEERVQQELQAARQRDADIEQEVHNVMRRPLNLLQ